MFTNACFVRKNTEELRDRLEGLFGIKCLYREPGGKFLVAMESYYTIEKVLNIYPEDNAIDCGTDEDLFSAIAAVRDDTDKYQYFTNGKAWKTCFQDTANFALEMNHNDPTEKWHKATVKELINHFKE